MVGVGAVGGSLYLAELIDEHGEALYADFQSEYHVSLTDVLFDRAPREVLALIRGLPDTSRFVAHVQGGDERWREFFGWGTDRHEFVNLLDLLVQINTEKGKKAYQYPRPSVEKKSEGTPFMALIPRRKPKGD